MPDVGDRRAQDIAGVGTTGTSSGAQSEPHARPTRRPPFLGGCRR